MSRAAGEESHPFRDADEVFRSEIPSRLEERGPLIDAALERLASAGCHPDPFFDRLCLDEVLVNAILHGNGGSPEKKVTVRAFVSGKRWGFEVSDQGKGFDWERVLSRIGGPDQGGRSGRGIALVVATGAEVHFLGGGARVVVVRSCEVPGRE